MHTSGKHEIFTVAQSSSTWTFHGPISADGGISHPVSRCSFVIDSKSGRGCAADKARLSAAMSGAQGGIEPTPGILVTIGTKGAKCLSGIHGQKVGKTEWGSKAGAVQTAQIVEKMGNKPPNILSLSLNTVF
jgi:syntaxin-binding protein 5